MLLLLREIDRRDRVLSRLGWGQMALVAIMLVAMPLDQRTILGVSPWLKPSKFAVSITIYVWTLAWFMPYVTGPAWAKALIRWGTTVAMTVEIICIAGQSMRGTTSHFNNSTPLNSTIFTVMGLLILFNTLLNAFLLVLFFIRHIALPAAYLWGIRCGLLGVILASGIGILMVGNEAHAIGATDGGPGLPMVSWSTEAGDLRVSHALGLHALQILPLVGYALSRLRLLSPRTQTVALGLAALLYCFLTTATLCQAVAGRPLVGVPLCG